MSYFCMYLGPGWYRRELVLLKHEHRPLRQTNTELSISTHIYVGKIVARVGPATILWSLRVENLRPSIPRAADVDPINWVIPLVVAQVHDNEDHIPCIIPPLERKHTVLCIEVRRQRWNV